MIARNISRCLTFALALTAGMGVLLPDDALAKRRAKSRASARPTPSSRAVKAPRLAAPQVASLRCFTAPDHTRLVVGLAGGARADDVECDSLSSPRTITLRCAGMTRGDGIAALTVKDGAVRGVAVESDDEGVRILVTLDHPASLNVLTLEEEAGRPARFVLDVLRPVSAAFEAREDSVFAALKDQRTHIIALDAGHGGEDYGAIGKMGTPEKSVTLAVVESLATRLNAMPGFRAVLTRRGDYFIPLRERTRIARRAKADLFVSVHCNASRNRQATGTEVYFLSPHGATDELARATAQRENEADLMGGLAATQGDEVGAILLDLAQTASVERSSVLAEAALDHLALASDITTRGVKQAGFVVLKTVDVPSILVETAFISNPREEELLGDPLFQAALADRLADAIRAYFTRFHGD